MTSNVASSMSIQALLHFYVILTSANQKADSAMNVVYGFPLNTYSGTAQALYYSSNDGTYALSTGMKLYIANDVSPLAEYYGFYTLRMIPFFKATGGNEVEVLVSTARAVKCWSWGSYNGAGFAFIHTHVPMVDYLTSDKYAPLMQFRGLNMVICKLGTTAGTATTGDVVIIPATQLAPDYPATVNNPLPLATVTTPVLASSRESMLTACNSVNPAIIAGADEYLGTMNFISNADTAYSGIVPTQDYPGTTSAVPIPGTFTLNNNAGATTRYDIVGKTDPATNWVVGAAKLDAVL